MGLYPYWQSKDGLSWRVKGYATIQPENEMIVILESLHGHLDEAIRYPDLASTYEQTAPPI